MKHRAGVAVAALASGLLGGTTAAAADLRSPGPARDEARRILAERRFHASHAPQPLRPVLSAIGHAAERLADWLRPLWHPLVWLAQRFPGGIEAFWLVVALGVVVGAALLFRSLARRRDRRALLGPAGRGRSPGEADPAALERAAQAAESGGDLELAVRLRFRAGVARLQRANVVPPSGIYTSRELSRRLRSREFDLAAGLFDEIVYGRRPARAVDVATTREAWTHVLRAVQDR